MRWRGFKDDRRDFEEDKRAIGRDTVRRTMLQDSREGGVALFRGRYVTAEDLERKKEALRLRLAEAAQQRVWKAIWNGFVSIFTNMPFPR